MKYWANTYFEGEICMYNNASKSFQECLEKFVINYFIEALGQIFNPKEFSLSIPSKPLFNELTMETYAPKITLGYFGHYGFSCEIFWSYKDKKKELKLLDEISEDEVQFTLKPYVPVDSLRRDILENAKQKKDFFLEGYRFVVLIKNIEIDARLKIKFQNLVNNETVQNVGKYLGQTIESFNSFSENNDNGLIHSYRFISKTKEFLSFKLDLGSSSKEGVEFILKALDESDFLILKIELSKN